MSANLPWFSRNAVALGAVALSVGVLAACSSSGSSSSSTSSAAGSATSSGSASAASSSAPITIGASLSLTGDFSADGQAFKQGYQLWVKDVNAAGGILGRQVKLTVLDDKSDPNQVVTNYQTLINTDHVDLTFGPFSSLLTAPASAVAARNGYAFVEGAGGAPSVFDTQANQADHNTFDVSLPVADELMPFVNYIASLPAGHPGQADGGVPVGGRPVRHPAGAARPGQARGARGQDGVLQGLPGGDLVLQAAGRHRGGQEAGHRGARLDRRADRRGVHARVRAGPLHAEDVHRGGRPRPGRRLHQGGGRGQRDRHDGAQRLVPRLRQRGQPEDGRRVRRAVRRHRLRRQRRRGRGLLGRPGRRSRRSPRSAASTTPRSSPTCTAATRCRRCRAR